ncbi:MAG: hypothetical protein IPH45_07300 [Bacteroidales bacterium]|nr:hypothetical protein [Bacteroidales bacterium]
MKFFRNSFLLLFLALSGFCNNEAVSITSSHAEGLRGSVPENPENPYLNELSLLTNRINSDYATPSSRILAIYTWIGENISYDMDQLIHPEPYRTNQELLIQVLESRKAICQGYAALFDEMCRQCGITSFTVHGYTKLNGEIQETPHAWNAAFIDGKWQQYDATWGAGHVIDNQYMQNFKLDQFNIQPKDLLINRMPFDPIWQLLESPMSHNEVIYEKVATNRLEKQQFNDSITLFLQQDSLGRLQSESRRVMAAGLDHPLIRDYYNYLAGNLKVMQQNRVINMKNILIDRVNESISHLNQAVSTFNEYIQAKNAQFKKPLYTDTQVKALIDDPDLQLLRCELLLQTVTSGDADIAKLTKDLGKNVKELRNAVDAEKKFVEKYLVTQKNMRINLFRTPVNKRSTRK